MEQTQFEEMKSQATIQDNKGYRGFYSYVTENGWKMEKDDLVNIIKELDYAIGAELSPKEYNHIIDESLNELSNLVDKEV